jgi:CspA family cold shock protein
MSASDSSVTSSQVSSEKFVGRVKWFNNKAGYGFISITDGSRSGSDIFVHHNSISVESEQYKYLVQGEYVEFQLKAMEGNSSHEFQASNVKGIKGGKLMCETRKDVRTARYEYKSSNNTQQQTTPPIKPRSIRAPSQKGTEGYQKVQRNRKSSNTKSDNTNK